MGVKIVSHAEAAACRITALISLLGVVELELTKSLNDFSPCLLNLSASVYAVNGSRQCVCVSK